MKLKYIIISTAAMVLAASCSNDAVVEEQANQNSIKFSATTGNASRSKDYYCNNALPANFHVWAAVNNADGTLKNYFADEVFGRVSGTSTDYTIVGGTERYLPNEVLSCWAATNFDEGSFTWNPTGRSSMKFTPKEKSEDQLDLIYAYTKARRKAADFDGKVKINFRHALSQIVFRAKNDNTNIYVEIESVSLNNAASSGVFTLPYGNSITDINFEDHTQTGDNTNGGTGDWTREYNATAIQKYTADCKDADGKLIPIGKTPVNLTDTEKDAEDKETAISKSLLMIPETHLTAWDPKSGAVAAGNGAFISVKCKIRNIASPDGQVKPKDIYLWGSADEAAELAIPCEFNWLQGKKYIYTISFTTNGHAGYDPGDGSNVLIPIEFSVNVDDFGSRKYIDAE